jgi:hypothetical protein
MHRQPKGRFAIALLFSLGTASITVAQETIPNRVFPSNTQPILYAPPERVAAGTPAPEHYVNVFLPPGTPPTAGWPVVVTTGFGGGIATPPQRLLGRIGPTAALHRLLGAGIAVVSYGVPGVGGGRGLWYPPGHPSGRYESFDPSNDNPEKSGMWAVQWARNQTEFPFDLSNMGLRGSSGGAVLAVRTAMGPNRASMDGSAQLQTETRVKAILAIQPPTSILALEQGPELTLGLPTHLEQAANPGSAANILDQVDHELQKDYSLFRTAFESAEARANNGEQRICLIFADPVLQIADQPATMALDGTGFPLLYDAINQPFQHDGWFGYIFFKSLLELSPTAEMFHRANSVFAMRRDYALAPPLDYHTTTFGGAFNGTEANDIGHLWLVSQLIGDDGGVDPPPPPPPPAAGALADASFEAQTAGTMPVDPWGAFGAGSQSVLSQGTDTEVGLPSDGLLWLELDANGTSGTTPPTNPSDATQPALGGSGVQQAFLFDPTQTMLQFEAAFVPADISSAARNDWMSVDISDGSTTWNLFFADTFSPLPMTSTRTGGAMTAVRTMTVDTAVLFPLADGTTPLLLSAQVGNFGDGLRPSIGYVDGFRLMAEANVRPYGCGINPSGSLLILSGRPELGQTMTFGVDNPLGTQAAGAIPVIAMSTVPARGFPCGIQRSGYGMAGDTGELLFNPARLLMPFVLGLPWQGPANPAPVSVPIPIDPVLAGVHAFVQGVLYDPSAPSGSRVKLGEAVELTLSL